MNRKRMLQRLAAGALQNASFSDLRSLVEGLGFHLVRVKGSHHIFVHQEVKEILNLQDVSGQAKPYQIRQLLRLIERYNLKLEDEA